MSSKNKQILQSNPQKQKIFDYTHGVVNIKITLRTDIKDQLKSGLQIGERFIADVKEELAKIK